jgi:hypothetical protein
MIKGLEVIYNKGGYIVQTNGSHEFFIFSHDGEVCLRVSPQINYIDATTGNGEGRLEPNSINGLPAFVAKPE